MKKTAAIVLLAAMVAVAASCSPASPLAAGNYYLDGDKNSQYIRIIDDSKMRLVGFDIDYLAHYLVSQGTGFVGQEAEDFMKRHNLPGVFDEEIVFEFDASDQYIYLEALSSENVDYFVANYHMLFDNEDTITFMENKYILR